MVRLVSMAACLFVGLVMFVLGIVSGFEWMGEEKAEPGPVTTPMAPKAQSWEHSGPFGTFDRAAAQRGLIVYKEVCSSCHGLKQVSFRTLTDIGLTADEVKAYAKTFEIAALDDDGEPVDRPGIPSDYFPSPFANAAQAAAANGGAIPPDLSLIVKARHHGDDYLYSLLTGYKDAPAGFEVSEGGNYNPYFSGRQLAMAPPLAADAVEYPDGTNATLEQMSRDVTVFLAWAAEPKMEARKQLGVKVMIFLLIFAGLMYAVKRKIWADQH